MLFAASFVSFFVANIDCDVDLSTTREFLRTKIKKDYSIEELQSLDSLNLSNKCISDEELKNICPLRSLISLDLFNDKCEDSQKLKGDGLKYLESLQSLNWLDLDSNQITADKIYPLAHLAKLTKLKLFNNRLSQGDPQRFLAKASQLEFINLDKNQIGAGATAWIKGLCSHLSQKPVTIRLARNQIENIDWDVLSDCQRPVAIGLSNTGYDTKSDDPHRNKISLARFSHWPKSSMIVRMDLEGALVLDDSVNFEGDFEFVRKSPNLEFLNLGFPDFNVQESLVSNLGVIASSVSRLEDRTTSFYLGLAHWNISGQSADALVQLAQKLDGIGLESNPQLKLRDVSSILNQKVSADLDLLMDGTAVVEIEQEIKSLLKSIAADEALMKKIEDGFHKDQSKEPGISFEDWLKAPGRKPLEQMYPEFKSSLMDSRAKLAEFMVQVPLAPIRVLVLEYRARVVEFVAPEGDAPAAKAVAWPRKLSISINGD